MIDIDIIEKEIRQLEARGDTTYSQCERLAWLYIVADHLRQVEMDKPVGAMQGSEFLECASGVPFMSLMAILNEHMEALRVVQPREYEAVLGKLRRLKNF